MLNLFCNRYIVRVVLVVIFICYSTTYAIIPPPRLEANLASAASVIKIIKILGKISKNNQGTEGSLASVLAVKNEIEGNLGTKISIGKCMEAVAAEMKKAGIPIKQRQLDVIRKCLQRRDQKQKRHVMYVESVMFLENYEWNEADEEMMFKNYCDNCDENGNEGMDEGKKNKDKEKQEAQQEEQELQEMPAMLVWGVTLTLLGVVAATVPVPVVQAWSQSLLTSGLGLCASVLCPALDEKNKKDKENKKFIKFP